jgi:hypothetical protein
VKSVAYMETGRPATEGVGLKREIVGVRDCRFLAARDGIPRLRRAGSLINTLNIMFDLPIPLKPGRFPLSLA